MMRETIYTLSSMYALSFKTQQQLISSKSNKTRTVRLFSSDIENFIFLPFIDSNYIQGEMRAAKRS